MMQCWSAIVVIPTICLAMIGLHVDAETKSGIFNVLLGLYKLNPLKDSDLYNSFSNNLLHGIVKKHITYDKKRPSHRWDLYNTTKNHTILLNELEKLLRPRLVSPKPKKEIIISKPKLDIDDVEFEDIILQRDDNNKSTEIDADESSEKFFVSGEMEPKYRASIKGPTKLIPIKDYIITKKLMNTILIPTFGGNNYKVDSWEYGLGNKDLEAILYNDENESREIIVF